MDFNKNIHGDNVEKLSRLLARRHRSRSFDLKNTEDIIEATIKATVEYVDMCDYWFRLVALRNEFDKSLECCEPSVWIKVNVTGDAEVEDIEDAKFNLEGASESLHNLMCRSEQKCISLWKIVLNSSKDEVKKYFFGEDIEVEEGIVIEVLENNMFNLANTMEYDGVMEHSVEYFAKELKKMLLQYRNNKGVKKEAFKKSAKLDVKDGVMIDFTKYLSKINR
jgi:hypothetical protein